MVAGSKRVRESRTRHEKDSETDDGSVFGAGFLGLPIVVGLASRYAVPRDDDDEDDDGGQAMANAKKSSKEAVEKASGEFAGFRAVGVIPNPVTPLRLYCCSRATNPSSSM